MITLGKILSRPLVAVMACALLGVFFAFAYPAMGAIMDTHTPPGAAFDTAFFYTPAEAASKAALYGVEDRAAIVKLHWTYDLAFPLSYGFFLAALWALGIRLLTRPGKPPRYGLLLVPLLAVLSDIAENVSIMALLSSDGAGMATTVAAVAASVCTVIKWLVVIPAFLGAVFLSLSGLIASSVRRFQRRRIVP